MGSGMQQEEESQEGDNQQFETNKKTLVQKDVFDLENCEVGSAYNSRMVADWRTVMRLPFQCIGVVYGDLGTSPLYVLPSTFPDGIKHSDDILGVLSLIFYSIVFITLIKYVFIVLAANDNGDGGTFALYSLICRYAKVNLIPNQQSEDGQVSRYKLDVPSRRVKMASAVKSMIENSYEMKYLIMFTTMLVLSAVGGIKEATSVLNENAIIRISVVILIFLFQIQRFGTDKVGYTFAPILIMWFAFIALIGISNFVRSDPSVIKAFNPWYIIRYFQRNKKDAWISLGGGVLCLTGSEALFADLGHFNIRSIQISSCSVLVPSVLLAYFGQCSYLRKFPDDVTDSFYRSIPGSLYWPQFILAILAAIIASQSLISASFFVLFYVHRFLLFFKQK